MVLENYRKLFFSKVVLNYFKFFKFKSNHFKFSTVIYYWKLFLIIGNCLKLWEVISN